MKSPAAITDPRADGRKRWKKRLFAGLIAAGAVLFVFGNAHLIYVAVQSQPDCVSYENADASARNGYSAAKPSC